MMLFIYEFPRRLEEDRKQPEAKEKLTPTRSFFVDSIVFPNYCKLDAALSLCSKYSATWDHVCGDAMI